ncbi:MAG TPA: ferredoxin [Candidatus Nanoarchaeia archaeon]|nr:ferredoxin [Candidatus Nanoarchaeia archaeon]
MTKYKFEIVTAECTGCAACNACCPENFEMTEIDGAPKAKAKKDECENLGCCMDAAQVCPVNCIHITDVDENKKLI